MTARHVAQGHAIARWTDTMIAPRSTAMVAHDDLRWKLGRTIPPSRLTETAFAILCHGTPLAVRGPSWTRPVVLVVEVYLVIFVGEAVGEEGDGGTTVATGAGTVISISEIDGIYHHTGTKGVENENATGGTGTAITSGVDDHRLGGGHPLAEIFETRGTREMRPWV
jgi:hypothetical protein